MKKNNYSLYRFAFLSSLITSSFLIQACGEHISIRKGVPLAPVAATQKDAPIVPPSEQPPSTPPPPSPDLKRRQHRKAQSPNPVVKPVVKPADGKKQADNKKADCTQNTTKSAHNINIQLPYAKALGFTVKDAKVHVKLVKTSVTVAGKKAVTAIQLKINGKSLDIVTTYDLSEQASDLVTMPVRAEGFPYRIKTRSEFHGGKFIMILQVMDDSLLDLLTGPSVLREFAVVVTKTGTAKSGVLVLNKKAPENLPTLNFLEVLQESFGP